MRLNAIVLIVTGTLSAVSAAADPAAKRTGKSPVLGTRVNVQDVVNPLAWTRIPRFVYLQQIDCG